LPPPVQKLIKHFNFFKKKISIFKKNSLFTRKIYININIRDQHRPIDIGLILLVFLSSALTFVLAEFFVYKLQEINNNYDLATISLIGNIRPSAKAAPGDVYYISHNAPNSVAWSQCRNNNSNPCSLSTANSSLTAGEIAYLMAGTYTTTINPTNSGSDGNYITYQADPTASSWAVESTAAIDFDEKDYIEISGIYFSGDATRIGNNDYLYIHDCRFAGPPGQSSYSRVRLDNCSYIKIIDNQFDDSQTTTADYDADVLRLETGSRVVIEGNTFGRSQHVSIGTGQVEWLVIRNNIVRNTWHTGIGVGNYRAGVSDRVLIENNVVYDFGDSYTTNPTYIARPWVTYPARHAGIQLGIKKAIFRNNKVYSGASALYFVGYDYEEANVYSSDDARVYHNVLYGSMRNFMEGLDIPISGLVIKNNVSFNAGTGTYDDEGNGIWDVDAEFLLYGGGDYPSTINLITYNAFDNSESNFVYKQPNPYIGTTLAAVTSAFPTEWVSNVALSNPYFSNPTTGDFTLTDQSTDLINAGTWLTTIKSPNGSGQTIIVDDPIYFYDGWGIPGEVGDMIYTSTGQSARINTVNYTSGEITLNSSIKWTKGDGITTVNYSGNAPDIGAYEYGATTQTCSDPANTPYGECTGTGGMYCDNFGKLIEDCTICKYCFGAYSCNNITKKCEVLSTCASQGGTCCNEGYTCQAKVAYNPEKSLRSLGVNWTNPYTGKQDNIVRSANINKYPSSAPISNIFKTAYRKISQVINNTIARLFKTNTGKKLAETIEEVRPSAKAQASLDIPFYTSFESNEGFHDTAGQTLDDWELYNTYRFDANYNGYADQGFSIVCNESTEGYPPRYGNQYWSLGTYTDSCITILNDSYKVYGVFENPNLRSNINVDIDDGTEYWVGWSSYIPSDYAVERYRQGMAAFTDGGCSSVNLLMIAWGGTDAIEENGGVFYRLKNDGAYITDGNLADDWKNYRGQWMDFVIHARFYSYDTANAVMEIYFNGDPTKV
jgi:hypothetical protein